MAKRSAIGSAGKRSASSIGLPSSPHRNKKLKRRAVPSGRIITSAENDPSSLDNPSSSAFSTRYVPPASLPSLAAICARVFVKHFQMLSDEIHWVETRNWLKLIPDSLASKLFAMLQITHPMLISHAVVATVREFVKFT